MISISAIKGSAGGAAAYYTQEEKNYYLSEKGIGNGAQWFGKGAEINGLLGKPVTQQDLETILSGKTKDAEVKKSFKGELRPGWDLTFSAPKSVSVLALVYGKKAIVSAHDYAVKTALKQIEKDAAQVRVFNKATEEMDFVNTGNITAAMVRHATSREMDPQIHTHCLIANMSYDLMGKLRAMASSREQKGDVVNGMAERVFRDQKFYTALYQSTLAKAVKELGYEVKGVGNGQFEIPSIPKSLVEEFSQRRQQIVEAAKVHGVQTSKGMDVATQATRRNKSYATMDALQSSWESRLTKHDSFDPDSIKSVTHNTISESVSQDAKDSLDLTLTHLGHTNTAVRYEKLMETALGEFSMEKGVTLAELNNVLNAKLDSGEVIPLDKRQTIYTTQALLDKEQSLVDQTKVPMRGMKSLIDRQALDQLTLGKDNKNNLIDLMLSANQINVVNVRGGSKQVLEGLLHLSENSGLKVQVLSTNRQEKNQLSRQVNRQSHSLSQWLKNNFRGECHDTVGHYLYQSELEAGKKTKGQGLVIVDQANNLGVDEVCDLIKATQAKKSKIVFVNHDSKLKGYKFGNAFETLKRGDIKQVRWVNNCYSQAAVNIHSSLDDKERAAILIKDYVSLNMADRDKTQVISTARADVANLNAGIREALKVTGDIGRVERSFTNVTPVFLSKEECLVPKGYKAGMLLKVFGEKSTDSFYVKSVDKQNQLLLLSNHRGKISEHRIGDLAKKSFMAFRESPMAIAKGDKLRVAADMKRFGIEAGESLTVKGSGRFLTSFTRENGKTLHLPSRDLNGASFQYDYAKTVGQAVLAKDRTLLMTKSYAAKAELLDTVLGKTLKNVEIYTNDEQKLQTSLAQNKVQPTAINTVIDAAKTTHHTTGIDKFVGEGTGKSIASDLKSAIHHLQGIGKQSTLDKAVDYALEKISEKEAAFRHQDLVVEALHYALTEEGSPLDKSQVESKVAEIKEQGGLLSADYSDGVRWATKEAIETETRILNRIEEGKGQVKPFADAKAVEKNLMDSTLTPSQQEAVFLISTTSDRFTAIQGLPGTGKSTMLTHATSLISESQKLVGDKVNFVGLAPTWQSVNELQDKGVKAQTFASFLKDVDQGDFSSDKYSNTLFLFDEASMASNKDRDAFTEAVKKAGARATDVGDIEQLQGQGAGKPFELSIKRGVINHATLTDIVRQKEPALKMAVEQVIDKDIVGAFESIQAQSDFKSIESKDDQISLATPENIIETKGEYSDDPKLNRELAKAAVITKGAEEYLSRTPESRQNSIFIAYSNRERDEFSAEVRKGLKTEGVIDKKTEAKIDRLRGINYTRAEMKTLEVYQGYKGKWDAPDQTLILSLGKNQYYEVQGVDEATKLVTLYDPETQKEKLFNPAKHDHKMTQLFSRTSPKLAEGDSIVLRRADKDRGHIPNIQYEVSGINKKTGDVQIKNGEGSLSLNTQKLKDCHWDYAYSKTSDMAQSATRKYVVPMVTAESPLTSVRRAVVDMSRATTHAKLITDDKDKLIARLEGKTLQSVATNHGDKRSALDTIEKKIYDKANYFDYNDNSDQSLKQFEKREWDHDKINKGFLTSQNGYYDFFGAPNKITKDAIIWDDHRVARTGEHAGKWSKVDNPKEYKNAVDAVTLTHGLIGEAANQMACDLSGLTLDEVSKPYDADSRFTEENKNRITSAKSIYEGTKDIAGTLGERYLHKTRGISKETIQRSEIKFWDRGVTWQNTDKDGQLVEQVNKTRAIVTPGVNKHGEITGVQRIYLDGNKPQKNRFMENPKLSKGVVGGAPGLIQQGNDGRVFVAEGPETALSIAEVEPSATVLCSFSVENLKKMGDALESYAPSEVIITGDNDGANSNAFNKTEEAKEQLESSTGLKVTTIYPEALPGQDKTDYNDILIAQGKDALKQMIKHDLTMDSGLKEVLMDKYLTILKDTENTGDIAKLADAVDQVKEELKLGGKNYDHLIEVLNSSDDISKVIDQLSHDKERVDTDGKGEVTWLGAQLSNIELQI